MRKLVALILLALAGNALGQTHTMTGNNVVPSGSNLIFNTGSTLDITNATKTGFAYEPPLGNPGTNGFVLSSTTAGVRSWIAPGGGGGAPTTSKYILQTADGSLPNAQALGALATGLLKSTTSTGVLSIGAAGTDYVAPGGALGTPSSGTLTSCTFPTLNQNTTGSAATLTTSRTINGVGFNGSANIVSPAIGVARKIVVSDGTNWNASTETYAVPGTSGNVMKSDGTNWTSAAPSAGAAAGSDTQIQYNNAGAFGAIASATYVTSTGALTLKSAGTNQDLNLGPSGTGSTVVSSNPGAGAANNVVFNNTFGAGNFKNQFNMEGSGATKWAFGNDYNGNGGENFWIYDGIPATAAMVLDANSVRVRNSSYYGFNSVNDAGPGAGSIDTAIYRNAAGVIEINNGTAGTFRDLKSRSVIYSGSTVALLPATPVTGQTAYVTDGTASLAWGATVTGGATTKYLVWYNGANWTVVGK
jgi:hypothetical protein